MISPTKKIFLIASHVSLSGLLYGLDTGSIGVITQMDQFAASIGHLTSMQQGIYVSCILLSSSVSSLASGHISDRISRKYGLLIGSILSLTGTVISASSPSFAALIVGRLITGMGMGQAISVATVYLVEIATADIRGVTACLLQLFVVVGIMIGYFIAYGSHQLSGSLAWRLPFIVQAVMAAVLSLGLLFLPFSPRWLVQAGRSDDARRVLTKLRTEAAVDSELWVTGIVMLVCTIPAQIWIDRWGRRMPLVIGGLVMAICFIVTGSLYARYGHTTADSVILTSTAAQWVVIVLIYVFVANFSWSWAVVGKIYASEIIPTRLRAKVCALELVANWIVNFIVTLTAPLFLRSSPSGPYFLYGFATILSAAVCYLMPETKGQSLEKIEGLFEKGGDGEEPRV
ncbi:high-affinity glucose transporter [Aspergillus lentulus]|uniref:High-affinity glucose transporter n=1 Tax=Aspergillus lentulus TaxID=293939 RepID=A0ABQ1AZL3_ASPLE|nr:high-affinity glucose transporter [Aspergillus lentulus]GFF91002.1 high-affinity glucose transporter [Aspergillus lentulus]GFG17213.1 high-affinity glucose transporter [Aspergillus lentulus]